MKCFYCKKEIEKDESTIIALDSPYVNLFVHRKECLPKIENYGTLKYVQENIEKINAYIEERSAKEQTVKRGR